MMQQHTPVAKKFGNQHVLTRRNTNIAMAELEPAHVMPNQHKMLKAFHGNEIDYYKLLDAINAAEIQSSPQKTSSRVIGRDDWDIPALALLYQLEPDVLKAMIDNTFPQRWLRDLNNVLRDPKAIRDGFDPVIYANWIMDKTGKGVAVKDLPRFHAFLLCAVGEYGTPKDHEKFGAALNWTWSQMPTVPTAARAHKFTDEIARDKSLKDHVKAWVEMQRKTVLPLASAQGVSHVPIHAEVGMSSEGYKRCKVHVELAPKSLMILKLIHVVLRTMFPSKGFYMLTRIVFHCFEPKQVEIGESILSLLTSSYVTTGGLNFAQAGVSISGTNSMNAYDWKAVCTRLVQPTTYYLVHCKTNGEAYVARMNKRLAEVNRRMEQSRLNDDQKKVSRDIDKLQQELSMAATKARAQYLELKTKVDNYCLWAADVVRDLESHRAGRKALHQIHREVHSIDLPEDDLDLDADESAAIEAGRELIAAISSALEEDNAAIAGVTPKAPLRAPAVPGRQRTPSPPKRRRSSSHVSEWLPPEPEAPDGFHYVMEPVMDKDGKPWGSPRRVLRPKDIDE